VAWVIRSAVREEFLVLATPGSSPAALAGRSDGNQDL